MKDNRRVRTYILLVMGWTYTFWILAAIISSTNPAWPGVQVLHFLGGVGPVVAAITVVTQAKIWREYLSRLVNFSDLFPIGWLIILTPILFELFASLISEGKIVISQEFINQGILYAAFLFFFGPLPEELGWRGVLFEGLSKGSVLKAQAVTAGVWLVWHLPLFFIVGSYQWELGFATKDFAFFAFGLTLQSFVMGYLYIISNRSIASAVLFHYMVNLAGEAFTQDDTGQVLILAFYLVLVAVLAFVFSQRKKLIEK